MPFNGSGVFQRIYSWVDDRNDGINILAERMDNEFNGIVAGLNNVVDGSRAFIGTVKAPGGTEASPAVTFSNDLDTGVYRASENVLGFSVNGTVEAKVKAGAFEVVNDLEVGASITGASIDLGSVTLSGTLAEFNGALTGDSFVAMSASATASEIQSGASSKFVAPDRVYTANAPITSSGSGSIELDLDAGRVFQHTLTGDSTLANPSNATPGQSGLIYIIQDSSTARTLAFGTRWKKTTDPTISPDANSVNVFSYYVRTATSITLSFLGVES